MKEYMTVEYFEKGFKVISNDYPRSLRECADAVGRLRKSHMPSARFGIVQLVELTPYEYPTLAIDWLTAEGTPPPSSRPIQANGLKP